MPHSDWERLSWEFADCGDANGQSTSEMYFFFSFRQKINIRNSHEQSIFVMFTPFMYAAAILGGDLRDTQRAQKKMVRF